MTLLNKFFHFVANAWIMVWYYVSELGKRLSLRPSAFHAAGERAGGHGCSDEVWQIPFILRAQIAFEQLGMDWSKRVSLSIERLEAALQSIRKEVALDEVYDLKAIEERCRRILGYVPHFNPYAPEIFWSGLFVGGAIEFFVNSTAFETASESEASTRIMAAIIALGFVVGVHLLGKHKAQGKSIVLLFVALVGLLGGITWIRENALVAYLKQVRESVPELNASNVDPLVYVLLFCCVQFLFFYAAYHFAIEHYNQHHAEHHRAKMAERRQRLYDSRIAEINRRLNRKALICLTEWDSFQRHFDDCVMIFVERASIYRREGPVGYSRLLLHEPPVVTWSRLRLGTNLPPTHLVAAA
jgi:hypothetical protein